MQTVLTLFAHPDDETNIGGTLVRLQGRCRLVLLCLTRGERGLSPGYIEARAETGRIREAEMRAVAHQLGAEVRFLDLIDREVYADLAICTRVAAILREVQPAVFFSMWPIDCHPDHAATSEIARKAILLAEYAGEFWMAEASMYQTAQFDPDLCVDIAGVLEQKEQLIRCHACQNPDDYLVQEARIQNRFRGLTGGLAYAEGLRSMFPPVAGRKSALAELLAGFS